MPPRCAIDKQTIKQLSVDHKTDSVASVPKPELAALARSVHGRSAACGCSMVRMLSLKGWRSGSVIIRITVTIRRVLHTAAYM